MIGYLQGRPLRNSDEHLTILVQGVGYDVLCSTQTRAAIEGRSFVELWVHTHVREDALQLFGFSTEMEKSLFLALLKVNGVGPKSALAILSGAPAEQILAWIESADSRALAKLPKLGKKTAEQIVLTLQGKLVRATEISAGGPFAARSQVISALVNLGFRLTDVEKAVDELSGDLDFETSLRQGLTALTR